MGASWPPRGPDDLDEAQRARIRRDVLAHVRPRRPGLSDHAYTALTILAAPAPHIVRVFVVLAVVAAVAASATVASADSLPEEPLYGVKLASEQVRLALAQSPEDRASVRLSMAEHRLGEAERLALAGREAEALIATSAYATHLAQAAAELAAIERLQANGPAVVARLRHRLGEQQQRAADVASRLAADPANAPSAPAFESVASAPPPEASGMVSERIAQHAASVTDQVAAVAEQRAQETPPGPPAPAEPAAPAVVDQPPRAVRQAPAGRVAPPPAGAPAPAGVGSVAVPVPTAESDAKAEAERKEAARKEEERKKEQAAASDKRKDLDAQFAKAKRDFQQAIEKIKEEQKKARQAVDKAKERGKKTPTPAPAKAGR